MYTSAVYFVLGLFHLGYPANGVSLGISPEYINISDSFTISCLSSAPTATSLLRGDEVCVISCTVDDIFCDHASSRFIINECGGELTVTVNSSIENDFTSWTCSFEGEDNKTLNRYIPVSLTYLNLERDVIVDNIHNFTCQGTDGKPGALINWLVNGKAVNDGVVQENTTDTQTSVLTLFPEKSHETIQCTAQQLDSKDVVFGTIIHLNVMFPPEKAVITTKQVTVLVGETATFECGVAGPGNPNSYTFAWTRRSGDFDKVSHDGTLEFVVTSVEEEDTYYCTPSNVAGEGTEDSLELTVNSHPQIVNSSVSLLTIFYTDTLSLDCVVEGKPAFQSITWDIPESLKHIFISTDKGSIPTGKLTRHTVRLEWSVSDDIGLRKAGNLEVINCVANNGIEPRVNHSTTMDIQYEPGQASLLLTQEQVYVNQTVQLTCHTPDPGNPRAIQYIFNSSGGWTANNTKNALNALLPINSVKQEGDYFCTGVNFPEKYPDGLEGHLSSAKPLVVLVPPITLSPTSTEKETPIYNEEHSIKCTVTGKPQVDISWTKNASPITRDDFLSQEDKLISVPDAPYDLTEATESRLTWIPMTDVTCGSVTTYDGNYRCKATSGDKVAESEVIEVVTQYPPLWNGPGLIYAEYNKTVIINCSVCANPIPETYSWYKEGQLLPGEENGQIEIKKVVKSDIGIYTCNVYNGIITAVNYTINVTEAGPPVIQKLQVLENKTSTVVPLSWDIYTDGGFGPLLFHVYYTSGNGTFYLAGENIPQYSETKINFDVQGLNPQTNYSFRVMARNQRGIDSFSTNISSSGNTLSPIKIKLTSANVDDTSIHLTWNFETDSRKRRNLGSRQVTLCFEYRKKGTDTWTSYPSGRNCSIAAELEKYVIHGVFDSKHTYEIILRVFENGYPGSQNDPEDFESAINLEETQSLTGGAVAGIVIAALLVVASGILLGGLVYKRRPFLKRGHEEQDTDMSSDLQHAIIPPNNHRDSIGIVQNINAEDATASFNHIPQKDTKTETTRQGNTISEEQIIYADLDMNKLAPREQSDDMTALPDSEAKLVYVELDFHNQKPVMGNSKQVIERKPPPKNPKPENLVLDTAITAKPPISPKPNSTADRISDKKQFLDVDDTFHIKASYSCSDPSRVLTWKYNEEGLVQDPSRGVSIHNTENTSELVVSEAQKEQSGKYTFQVSGRNGSSSVDFYIVVIGRIITSIQTDDGLIEMSEPSTDGEEDEMEYFGDLPNSLLI